MALLSVSNLRMTFGGPSLMDGISFSIHEGERICLLGRNGEGKSTLLNILAGKIQPDAGTIAINRQIRVAMLPQVVPTDLKGRVEDVVATGVDSKVEEWRKNAQIGQALSWTELDASAECSELSGGMKRRVLLAQALASKPELLLLDEPTNHLDMASIAWLEQFLISFPGAILFVTHDRAFLKKIATRVMELDRGKLSSWECGYEQFLERKQAFLHAEEERWRVLDKKLAGEEAWIRKGIEARRTRNEGRVRELFRLRTERALRRERLGTLQVTAQEAERSGYSVLKAVKLGYSYDSRWLFRNLTLQVCRGDKIGLIGPNGCGKTTLVQVLLGQRPPSEGHIFHGTQLEVAYFDQLRSQLDENQTVVDQVADGNEFIIVNGQRRHVLGYLEDFLFTAERARSPVRALSGGERSRLLLARLFAHPSNVLVLDEPTNDLDIETLELLESMLVQYAGTILLVTHDRAFLDEVATSVLVFEEDGVVREYAGGYEDWLRQRTPSSISSSRSLPLPNSPASEGSGRRKSLSNRERKELQDLPEHIEVLEKELQDLHLQMASADFYRTSLPTRQRIQARAEALPMEVDDLYQRWNELESVGKDEEQLNS